MYENAEPIIKVNGSKTGLVGLLQQKSEIKIGNYIVSQNIGNGSFGKVFLGIHINTGEKVAIKQIDKKKLKANCVERVKREISNLRKLHHSSIIQLYQFFDQEKFLYLIMQYASEGELFDYIVRHKRLDEVQACRIFKQILSGIQYLHECGIAHRDLKAENILLDYNLTIKIIDFGLSNSYRKNEKLKTSCGSPCYIAPQMIEGKKPYEPIGVDIWSAGIILYAMLCGCLPFVDDSPKKIYEKIMAGRFKVPKTMSSEAKNLLSRLLLVNPQKRITINEIKSHKWLKLTSQPNFCGIIPKIHSIPIDMNIIHMIEKYFVNAHECIQQLTKRKLTPLAATYHILLKKLVREGGHSDYYIGSNKFNPDFLPMEKEMCLQTDEQTKITFFVPDQQIPPLHLQPPTSGSNYEQQQTSNYQHNYKIFPCKIFPQFVNSVLAISKDKKIKVSFPKINIISVSLNLQRKLLSKALNNGKLTPKLNNIKRIGISQQKIMQKVNSKNKIFIKKLYMKKQKNQQINYFKKVATKDQRSLLQKDQNNITNKISTLKNIVI